MTMVVKEGRSVDDDVQQDRNCFVLDCLGSLDVLDKVERVIAIERARVP